MIPVVIVLFFSDVKLEPVVSDVEAEAKPIEIRKKKRIDVVTNSSS